jgi:hypothetical protein
VEQPVGVEEDVVLGDGRIAVRLAVGSQGGVGNVVDALVGIVSTEIEAAIDGQLTVGVAGEELAAAPGPCDVQIRDRIQHKDRERHGGPAAYVVEADVGVGRRWEQAVQLVHHVVQPRVEDHMLLSEGAVGGNILASLIEGVGDPAGDIRLVDLPVTPAGLWDLSPFYSLAPGPDL